MQWQQLQSAVATTTKQSERRINKHHQWLHLHAGVSAQPLSSTNASRLKRSINLQALEDIRGGQTQAKRLLHRLQAAVGDRGHRVQGADGLALPRQQLQRVETLDDMSIGHCMRTHRLTTSQLRRASFLVVLVKTFL